MITVRMLLESKGYDVWSIPPDAPVYEALKLLAEKDIGALLVTEGGDLRGVVSERDYARKVILKGKASMTTPVKDIMTEHVIVISPEEDIRRAMALMTEKRIRHLPVTEDSKVIGVISIGDVVKGVIEHQEFMIDQLENYITGSR